MPAAIPAVIGAVGSAAAAAVPAAGLFGIPAIVAQAGIGLITTGLQFGAQLLFAPDEPRQSASRQVGTLPPLGTRYIALGRVKSGVERGAHIVHRDADGDDTWWQFVAISYGQINSIVTHYIDGEAVTLDGSAYVTSPTKWGNQLVRIQTRLGAQTATLATAATAFSGYWTTDHVGRGIAYAAVQQKPVSASKFRSTYPNHFVQYSALIEGALLPDPASTTNTYSNNAARAVLWHLLDTVAGYGLDRAEIDLNSFAAYAAVCDELVPLGAGGTEKRYTTNGFVDLGRRKIDVLRDLLANCDADLVTNDAGLLEIIPMYRPPIYSLADTATIGVRLQAGVPEEQRVNAVVATYTSPTLDYAGTTTPPWNLPLQAGEPRATGSISLPFCTSATHAQRLAKKAAIRANPLASGEITTQLQALHLRPGDYVTMDGPDDLIGEPVRVEAREIVMPQSEQDGAPILSFQVTALDPAYDEWSVSDEQTVSAPPAVNGVGDIVSAPSITSTAVEQKLLGGALGSVIVVNFTAESADLVAELEWSVAGDDEYEGPRRRGAQQGTITTDILEEGQSYDVRLRFVLRDGTGTTDWSEETGITVQADAIAPASGTVSASTGGGGGGVISVTITAPSDSNYYRTRVKYAVVTGSETFASATQHSYVLYNQAGGSTTFNITGLTASTNYRVYAQAQNISGAGSATPPSDTATSSSP